MPLYEYACDACGHRFELIRKFSDVPLEACPKCGGVVRKLLSSPAFHLKGSGWYATDYAKKPESKGKADAAGESAEKSGSDSKEPAKEAPKETKDAKEAKETPAVKESAPKESGAKESGSSKS